MNNAAKPRILLVEDDLTVQNLVSTALDLHGYVVSKVCNGQAAIMDAVSHGPSLIMLDLGLPDIDGIEVITKIRSWSAVPIIVISARSEDSDKIAALDAGADDYLTKPFQVAELVARVQALVRRAAGNASSILEIGGVRLDMAASQVWYEGTPIKLTAHEFRVLGYLMQHRGKVVSRSELIDHIYAQDFDRDSNTVEVFIGRIRKKTHADLIETVRGLGYRINE